MAVSSVEVTGEFGTLRIEQHLAEVPWPAWPWVRSHAAMGKPVYFLNGVEISEAEAQRLYEAACAS